nr:diguanylate cyclase [Quadrisphaera sp. RL12-1S]
MLGAVHSAVSHGVAVYTADGALLLANPAARALLGDNPREDQPDSWEGTYALRAADGSAVAPAELPITRALRGEHVTGVDLQVTGPADPRPRLYRVDAHPLPQVAGAAWSRGAVVVFHDVTQERAEAAEAARARDLLAGVLDGATTQGIIATDAEHRITVFSSGAERMLGWAAGEVVGGSPLRFVRHAEVHERALALGVPVGAPALLAGLAEGGHTTRRWTLVRRDGSTFTGEVTLTQTRDDDGALRSTTAVITDVTAEVAADAGRAEAELQFRLAFETAPTGMVLMSLEPGALGRLTRVNEAFAAFTGRPAEDLLDRRVRDLLHPDDTAGHLERLEQIARERTTERASREQRFVRPDGQVRWARTTPSLVEPADGGLPHLLVVVEDVTESRREQAALVHAALHDPLTGLPNRALFAQRLEEALRADARLLAGVTVLYADLDGFKPVNDEHGHAAGDELLRVVAERLRRAVRSGDTVARLGGDEFALLCPGLAAERVPDLLARVDAAVTAPVPLPGGAVVRVSASTGTATAVGEDDAQRLLDEADHSMYSVKRRRRREARPRSAGRLQG